MSRPVISDAFPTSSRLPEIAGQQRCNRVVLHNTKRKPDALRKISVDGRFSLVRVTRYCGGQLHKTMNKARRRVHEVCVWSTRSNCGSPVTASTIPGMCPRSTLGTAPSTNLRKITRTTALSQQRRSTAVKRMSLSMRMTSISEMAISMRARSIRGAGVRRIVLVLLAHGAFRLHERSVAARGNEDPVTS